MQKNFIKNLPQSLKECNNPVDTKSSLIAKVVKLDPIVVSIFEGKTLLTEHNELFTSEWFDFRCNIDKAGALSTTVPDDRELSNSKGTEAGEIKEVHSFGGLPCSMPNAIAFLMQSINIRYFKRIISNFGARIYSQTILQIR